MPFRQVIATTNTKKFMSVLDDHVVNLNHVLKSIKSDIIVDYRGLIITSNKVTSPSNISIINNYIKKCDNVNVKDIQDAYLLQSKSYLKILGIPYLIEGTNMPINSSVMELIIKSIHVFDNIKITLKPQVVKVSLKSDMAIVWTNIWNSQSSSVAKPLINYCFNISSFIATICGANMNPDVLQCKNC